MTERPLRATVSQRGVVFAPDDEVLLVRREIVEETGLDPDLGQPVHVTSWINDTAEGRFAVYYRCRTAERSVSLSAEHTDFEWRPPAGACDRLSDVQGRAVANAVAADGEVDAVELEIPVEV